MAAERWEAVLAQVAALGRAEVRAGIVGPKAAETHHGSDLTNAEMGLLHEMGSRDGRLPERSFVRETLRDQAFRKEFEALQATLIAAVLAGTMSRDAALDRLGRFAAEHMKARIEGHHVRPEDRPATVAAKGSDIPLLDQGQLVDAIGWQIRK